MEKDIYTHKDHEEQLTINNSQLTNNTPASHLPTTSKNNNFLVTLLSILLFIAVVVAGIFAWQTQNLAKQLQTIINNPEPTITALVETTPTPDPTIDWQTFDDKQWNYSIRYPANWKSITAEKPIVYFLPPQSTNIQDGSISVELTFNQTKPEIPMWFKNYSPINPSSFDNSSWAVVNTDTDEIAFWKNGTMVISLPKYNSYITKNLHIQILSTFKFLGVTASSTPSPRPSPLTN